MVYTGYEIDMSQPLHVIVDGKEYDLTKWKAVHPGGHFILQQYDNKDATDIFRAFHGEESFRRLEAMRGKAVDVHTDAEMLAFRHVPHADRTCLSSVFFSKFREGLERDGLFDASLVYNVVKATSTVAFIAGAIACVFWGHWIVGAILMGIGFQQLGWLAHDTCHHNFTKNRRLNDALSLFFGNVLNGFSVLWWKNRHNTHHAITNVLASDPDVDNLPLFVWDENDLPRVGDSWLASSIVTYQEFYFVPWTATLKLIWKLQSIAFVLTPEVHNKYFAERMFIDRLTLAVHWLWFLAVAWMTPTWTSFFSFILLAEGIGGAGIALIVFMNHYALELHGQDQRAAANFLDLQLRGTRNITPSPIMNWLSGGLNLQIEHHLFPTMPRHNLLKVRPLVQQFCRQHGYPYEELSYFECLCEVEKKLHRVSTMYLKKYRKLE